MAAIQKIIALVVSALTAFATFTGHFGLEVKPCDYEEYKNVIVMVGDGMGFNHLEATKQKYGIDKLAMEEDAVVKAQSKTDALFGILTDSAAGGTALACGIRTINGMVGSYALDPFGVFATPMNLSELAISLGKAAGVVTTDQTSGATPSAFSVHTFSRKETEDITEKQLASDLNLIWGGASGYADETVTVSAGRTYIDSLTDLNAYNGEGKSFAQFDFDDLKYVKNDHDTPTLDVLTEKAIDVLSKDEDGFFLMVEGACIDKHSHSNDLENMTLSTYEFDKAVKEALEFAEEDGETLVLVTADHETGGLTFDNETNTYYWTTGSHTDANVPVFVNVRESGLISGVQYENRHIGAHVGLLLGADERAFPGTSIQ